MKKEKKKLYIQQKKRHLKRIIGTEKTPRLSIYRSHNHIYAQLIDDNNGFTLCSFSTLELKNFFLNFSENTKTVKAFKIGQILANKINQLGLNSIVFDRGKKEYKGRIKSLAEGAREEALPF